MAAAARGASSALGVGASRRVPAIGSVPIAVTWFSPGTVRAAAAERRSQTTWRRLELPAAVVVVRALLRASVGAPANRHGLVIGHVPLVATSCSLGTAHASAAAHPRMRRRSPAVAGSMVCRLPAMSEQAVSSDLAIGTVQAAGISFSRKTQVAVAAAPQGRLKRLR